MLDWLYEWMKNIAFYMLLISAVLTVLPGKEYQKYIQFFSGLILIILLITPVLRVSGIKGSFDELYKNKVYEQELEEMELMEKYFEKIDIVDFISDEYIQNEKNENTEENKIMVEPIVIGE